MSLFDVTDPTAVTHVRFKGEGAASNEYIFRETEVIRNVAISVYWGILTNVAVILKILGPGCSGGTNGKITCTLIVNFIMLMDC